MVSSGNIPETHAQRQALLDIVRLCGGQGWMLRENWESDKPLHTWYGVECDSKGRVVKIELQNNNLQGAERIHKENVYLSGSISAIINTLAA
jgi:hypothetical protein